MYNEFKKLGMVRPVTTVVSQVVVDPEDPSFKHPSKPIGSFMAKDEADKHRAEEGWSVMEDAGRGYRRVVPSPLPQRIIELETIKTLIAAGITVIAAGGGGIPVLEGEDGLKPLEAVIDKDYAAALLAKEINADLLVISTAVEKVYTDYGKPSQKSLDDVGLSELRRLAAQGQFAPGSMLPKIEAMIDFVESTGKRGIITDPAHLSDALAGKTGTRIG
jgi:carbamate kinase